MSSATALDAPGLRLGPVTLTPPTAEDREAIRAAADDKTTWQWFTYRADGSNFDAFWPDFLGKHTPPSEVRHVVRLNGEVIGATSFLAVDTRHKRLEIGGTWYRADQRGRIVNPACKRLLLERAFAWGARRVEVKTDSLNVRSRAAIEKLGAQLDGVLPNHMINHDGLQQHTAMYSILPDMWPEIRTRLDARIAKFH